MKIVRYLFWGLMVLMIFVISCNEKGKTKESSGLFPVEQDGKWGYIDKTGKIGSSRLRSDSQRGWQR